MKFTDVSKVEDVVQRMREADEPRSENRANINRLFNGEPPFTSREQAENHINVNVNFLEAAKIAHDARRQFNNAFLKPGNYFSVRLTEGPIDKKREYSLVITQEINRIMKKSLPYVETLRSTFASVVLHGIGPVTWENSYKWCPIPLGIDDLYVPSKTTVSLENLDHFVIYRQYTPGKLFRMTHGKQVDPGWNLSLVRKVLAEVKDENVANSGDDYLKPEKLVERYKADLGYYESDAVPTINCYDLYFRDEEEEGEKWHRRMIVENQPKDTNKKEFLYNSKKRVVAKSLSELLHIQFGDGANVAPFRYHSVRSLGFMLYAVCHLQNRLRCRFSDAVFENMLMYFRVSNPEDLDRLQKIDLHNYGIVPEGLSWINGNERFQVNENLVAQAMQQNRQNMSENSASFIQDINNGTQTPMTATEAMARVNSGNALISAMLVLAYGYQTFQFMEIARRFCIKNSSDPDVQKFRKACISRGVPEKYIDSEKWDIEPERVLGAGNKMLEIAQADKLMSVRNLLDPDAALKALHIFVEANTDDPGLAEDLVPMRQKQISDAVHLAQDDSAVLMLGLPKVFRQGINHIQYVEALLAAMDAVIQRIEQSGGMATGPEIFGLQNMAATIGQHIQFIAQDDNEKQRVKQYEDILTKMMNMVRAYAQRLAEAQQKAAQANGNLPPEAIAKLRSAEILAASNAKIKEAKAAQAMSHKDVAFRADQARKNAAVGEEIKQGMARTEADIAAQDLLTAADIIREQRKGANPNETPES